MQLSRYDVPIVICIDVEPDLDFFIIEKNPNARATANMWDSFKASADFFESLRTTLSVQDKPVFSWFVRADPQVAFDFGSADYGFTRFRDHIDHWKAQDDEIGLHVHAWHHNPATEEWIDDRTDQDWVSNCVGVGFEAFRRQMGNEPRCFRFGNRWMNTPTMNLIRKLGTQVDMTLEPGYRESLWTPYLRGHPEWVNVPHVPYAPSLDDYTRPSGEMVGRLVELPLTMVIVSITRKLEKISGLLEAILAKKRNLSQVPHGPVMKELGWYLRLKYGRLDLSLSSLQFRKATRSILNRRDRPYFGLVLRSDQCQNRQECSLIGKNMGHLVEEIRRAGHSPTITTPPKAIEILGHT
jgi:hypothetical protein